MSNIVEIVIQEVDNVTGANGAIIGSFTELQSKIALAKEAVSAIKEAYNGTIGETIKYADEVRNLSAVTGLSTENASRFLEIADKTNVSVSALEMGLKFMAKNGVEPTIAGIAQLSDEYLRLAPGVDRDNFLIKEFGRSGFEMAQLMQQGSVAIDQLSESTSKNLILTQQQVDMAKRAEIAQKELGDAWQGNVVVLSNQFMPAITTLMNQFSALNESIAQNGYWYTVFHQNAIKASVVTQENIAATVSARTAINAHADALNGDTSAMTALGDATALSTDELNAMSKANVDQMGFVMKLQNVMKDYNKTLDETTKKYGENSKEVSDLEAQHAQSMRAIAYDLYVTKLQADGFTDAEFKMALAAGVTAGVLDQATVQMALDMDKAATAAATTKGQYDAVKAAADNLNGTVSTVTIVTNYQTNYTTTTGGNPGGPGQTGGTGSGGANCFVSGTKINLADGNKKNIENINVLDSVLSYDTKTKKFVTALVLKTFAHDVKEYLSINNLLVTPEHLVYVNGEWKGAGEIIIGDLLLFENGENIEVKTIAKIYKDVVVYNLETDHETHNYFADGVLVHNGKTNPNKMATKELGVIPDYSGIDYNRLGQVIAENIGKVVNR